MAAAGVVVVAAGAASGTACLLFADAVPAASIVSIAVSVMVDVAFPPAAATAGAAVVIACIIPSTTPCEIQH